MSDAVKIEKQTKDLLSSDSVSATTLIIILIDNYGTDALMWEPETIRTQLAIDYSVILSHDNMDKLMAAISVLTSNVSTTDAISFNNIVNALDGDGVSFDVFDPATPAEIAWAVAEIMLLMPPESGKKLTLSDEVKRYIRLILESHGFSNVPPMFEGLSEPMTVQTDIFADDPDLYSAAYKIEQDRIAEINDYVKAKFLALVQQLSSLRLTDGDNTAVTTFVERVQSDLQQKL